MSVVQVLPQSVAVRTECKTRDGLLIYERDDRRFRLFAILGSKRRSPRRKCADQCDVVVEQGR